MPMHLPPLFLRLIISSRVLRPVDSPYRIVYEDPDDLDEPVKIVTPAPMWVAQALAGWVLPPVECYLQDAEKPAGARMEHHFADPIGPLTHEQAIEYLVLKDVPRRVWGRWHNRPLVRIVRADSLPHQRTHRGAWRLAA